MQNNSPISAVLYGLEEKLADELAHALTACCRRIDRADADPAGSARMRGADVIFCRADVGDVRRLKAANPDTAVIVASRLPEVSDWLDALDAGAQDYCAAPFERVQVRWVLDSHVRTSHAAA